MLELQFTIGNMYRAAACDNACHRFVLHSIIQGALKGKRGALGGCRLVVRALEFHQAGDRAVLIATPMQGDDLGGIAGKYFALMMHASSPKLGALYGCSQIEFA